MNPLRKKLIKCILIRRIIKRQRKVRQFGTRPILLRRIEAGENLLIKELRNDGEYHKKYFRMSKQEFDYLLNMIKVDISHKINHACPISPMERLAITLRWLATGNSQASIGLSYRVSPTAVCQILRETMRTLCDQLESKYLPVPTKSTWKTSEEAFAKLWNFPNCCGSIDGKHIRIRCPSKTGSLHYNYKGFFSVVLLAVVDPFYRFIAVDIGACGSISDGGVLSRSTIGHALQENTDLFPEDKKVGDSVLPYVIVGDDAFPLRRNLMKPFPGKNLSTEKRVFNYRLSRARMTAENGFGILSARWRILLTMIHADVELVKLTVKTCVMLHNFMMTNNLAKSHDALDAMQECISGNDSIGAQGSNNYSGPASEIRNKFMNYFNNDGSVDWQHRVI